MEFQAWLLNDVFLLGQWLNDLNFLGFYIYSRENKAQTFISGFHSLSKFFFLTLFSTYG